ncbi:MAG TPA: rhomboid family intramembrane serine protease [Thermoanaerobaculia bacterium]|nr:rhomboid family intramembrane serine protease [Thermoanaerobaculia bacterium]
MRPSRTPATTALIAIIVAVFTAEIVKGIPLVGVSDADIPRLIEMGAIVPGIFARGDYWRLVAAMFLHIGILHLLLNLWALFQLGGVFETMFGTPRFVATYFVAGLSASIASAWNAGGVSAGASGAIFGILGALIFAIRRSPVWRHEPWTKNFTRQLIGWAALNVVVGFTVPGIDNAAHLGGFAMGLLLGFVPHRVPPPPPGRYVIDTEARRPGGEIPWDR